MPHRAAREIMTSPVVTLNQEMTLRDAGRVLTDSDISGAPVVDNDANLVGVLSEKDVLVQLQGYFNLPRIGLFGQSDLPESEFSQAVSDGMGLTVRDVMTYPVYSSTEDESLVHLVDLMVTHRLNRIPIVRDGKVIGIVTREDVLRAINQIEPFSSEGNVTK